jgi:hypothetical protein
MEYEALTLRTPEIGPVVALRQQYSGSPSFIQALSPALMSAEGLGDPTDSRGCWLTRY